MGRIGGIKSISSSSLFSFLFGNVESQNEKMMLQQLSISLFILSNCYSNFSQMKSYCNSSLNKKIVPSPAPFFNLSFFFFFFPSLLISTIGSLSLSLPFFPSLFSPFLQSCLLYWSSDLGLVWSADLNLGWSSISAWVERRSRLGWNADLGLGWSSIWVSWFGWILDNFLLVLLVD